ncbi:P-loop containing nucleoside triphosphate hydrolase protein [Plenodomus tracheiphilus IPT5]|uniref:P-loop containing nucleoside triphosphate hydrolase protein n=1 Tax=Plenodomus tracheiphilus IPT5 TaxID=1408161 RepID=A0A6A7BCK0_9PLEO|nr:P-loop containing nucleoside triphosphate hydrolase protein [Plenodomus tracheiphilus IPT5]
MDFTLLRHVDLNLDSPNGSLASLPSTVMEALIPGYRIIYQLFFGIFGIDIGLIMSGCLIVFALLQGVRMMYGHARRYLVTYFTSTINIEQYDDMYNVVLEWLAKQRATEGRGMKAVSSYWCDDKDDEGDDVLDEHGIFNYEKWANKLGLRFEPWYGESTFDFNARTFTVVRDRPGKSGEREVLALRCTGRSYDPIRVLLDNIRTSSSSNADKTTWVCRAEKRNNSEPHWHRQGSRPSRPLSTISLDRQSKARIVKDINEYLHPETARWYAKRGIPHRRGYLLHGPPGTGKTSLSFALAGVFGLSIYCMSLNEITTESDLSRLFSILPQRCIILLEDIDSAGLRRDNLPDASLSEEQTNSADEKPQTEPKKADTSKAPPTPISRTAISLCGLLNVIDGASSNEGRVLIMTTNCPESLDDALIRPGRVDLQIGFTLATQDQAREIYTRMYSTEKDKKKTASKATTTKITSPSSKPPGSAAKQASLGDEEFLKSLAFEHATQTLEPEKLAEMALSFAVQIPGKTFSPAEIQGYLLNLKQEPLRAVEEVGKWRDALLEAKKKGKKVVDER